MRIELLREGLVGRRDVAELCHRGGWGHLGELWAVTDGDNTETDRVVTWLTAQDDPAALELALGVLAPRLGWAVARIRPWTGEDPEELIASAAWEELAAGTMGDRPSVQIPSRARKRVVRDLQRRLRTSRREMPVEHETAFLSGSSVEDEALGRVEETELLEWLMGRRISETSARLVFDTRVGGVPLAVVAAAEGLMPDTAGRRRLRAEEKIRSHVRSVGVPLPIS